jgi:phosphoribosylformimino-5-aminoimidazole carboxamide ribotide isomerase
MTVLPIPAIDLMDGKVVRLSRGEARAKTVYSDDPVGVAREFEAAGARRLHVVDLDGAFGGRPANMATVAAICAAVGMEVEVGGGLRTAEAVEQVLETGARYAILGTGALRDRGMVERLAAAHGARLIVGIDARDGMVAVEGWVETSDLRATDFARQLGELGVGTAIATDIATDGMLTGPNLGFCRELAAAAPGLKLIASGGIRDIGDLEALEALKIPQLIGAISGRAIYEKTLDLAEAMRRVRG